MQVDAAGLQVCEEHLLSSANVSNVSSQHENVRSTRTRCCSGYVIMFVLVQVCLHLRAAIAPIRHK